MEQEKIKNLITLFEDFLQQNLLKAESFHPYYEKALNEMLLAGGKRFRPALVLAVAEAIDKKRVEAALYPALAIEMSHTYSLIHDDLPDMDNADFRRSHPTLHKTYGATAAILVGDALNTESFAAIARSPLAPEKIAKLARILAENAGANGMVLGQTLDCYFENQRLNLEQVEFIHRHKTGKLIAAALEMGAVAAGANDDLAQKLYDIGLRLGLLFQIRDDILDFQPNMEEQLGKPSNQDVNKNSFVTLLGEKEARERMRKTRIEIEARIASETPPSLAKNLTAIADHFF
ncbi:MAG: polyprenyl synthetase family protein [Helicobacteraceae bacterium]|jgi:farnesyl diphosphate synthase|nr:polyprenyl synthetase family protein [Helicobacteraceae bacterium]